eukprot:Polyplicarium_translucidae@DN892_c0_g1_i1.p1
MARNVAVQFVLAGLHCLPHTTGVCEYQCDGPSLGGMDCGRLTHHVCNGCGQVCDTPKKAESHVTYIHTESVHVCSACQFYSSKYSEILNHKSHECPETTDGKACTLCNELVADDDLHDHAACHVITSRTVSTCDLCNNGTNIVPAQVKRHFESCHKRGDACCRAENGDDRVSHMLEHHHTMSKEREVHGQRRDGTSKCHTIATFIAKNCTPMAYRCPWNCPKFLTDAVEYYYHSRECEERPKDVSHQNAPQRRQQSGTFTKCQCGSVFGCPSALLAHLAEQWDPAAESVEHSSTAEWNPAESVEHSFTAAEITSNERKRTFSDDGNDVDAKRKVTKTVNFSDVSDDESSLAETRIDPAWVANL